MHADEVDIDSSLVQDLIAEQFPQWRALSVERVPSAGTDNAMYRLGADMVVRLPRVPRASHAVALEQRWLPHLAPRLPLAVPVPLGLGVPGAGFDMPWSVYSWLPGANVFDEPLTDLTAAAHQLGEFITALRAVDPVDGPLSFRGDPILSRDTTVRAWLSDLGADGTIDGAAALAAWDDVLALPQWTGRPGWLHSDLIPGNLLAVDDTLTAVIDFGGVGVGDPACDLMPAWNLFDGRARDRKSVV